MRWVVIIKVHDNFYALKTANNRQSPHPLYYHIFLVTKQKSIRIYVPVNIPKIKGITKWEPLRNEIRMENESSVRGFFPMRKFMHNEATGMKLVAKKESVLFREVQKNNNVFVWVITVGLAALMWYGFVQQIVFGHPFGDHPASDPLMVILWIIFGIGFPVFAWSVKLITEVRTDGLYVRFIPFHLRYKKFSLDGIDSYQSITYSPLGRFGGWGIRFNFKGEMAYNMSGKLGLEIRYQSGVIVIGSKNPFELEKALDSAYKNRTP
jgi:uncharacterized membrane protein (DUF485 family)